MHLRACSLVIFVALLAGCAGADVMASPPSGPPANVSGSWSGWTSGASGTAVALTLSQTGDSVTGDIDVGGRPDISGPLKGNVLGNMVKFRLDTGYGSTADLRISGNTISGIVGGTQVNLSRK